MKKAPKIGAFRMTRALLQPDLTQELSIDADLYRWRMGGKQFFMVGTPDQAEHVLVEGYRTYAKSAQYELLKTVMGISLFTDEGESWARHRRMLQPKFGRSELAALAGLMVEPVQEFVRRWEDEETVNVSAAMTELTLDVVGRALFGRGFGDVAREIRHAVVHGVRSGIVAARLQMLISAPGWGVALAAWALRELPMPVRQLRNIQWMMRTVDGVIREVIDERRADPASGKGDLVQLLLDAHDEQGGLSMRRVRNELVTFMLAGHETTANALTWMWYLLARHPEARERLLAEVDEVLGGRVPTAADTERLVWTSACFQEAMRLYPPAWVMPRTAVRADVIDGYRIPKGATVMIPIYRIQRDARWWPDPESFDPARFLPERARTHPRGAYLPFGAGRRMCIGARFATMEAALITAMISQRFTLDLISDRPVQAQATITLRPRHSVKMRLVSRAPTPDPTGAHT